VRRAGVLLAAWVGLTGILIVAGIGVVHSPTVAAFDRHVTTTVVTHRTDALNQVMNVITWLGSWVALVAVALLLAVLAVCGRLRWLAAVLAVVAWVGEAVAVTLTKHIVQRQRPPKDIWLRTAHGWSWPSGHAATAALVFAVLALVVSHLYRSRFARAATWVTCVAAAAVVGFSRIELGVHWTTDVLVSFLFVSGWMIVIVTLFGAALREAQSNGPGEHSPA
jgi:undecaprenyl-diphosphatase